MAKIFNLAGELILGTRFKKLAEKYLDEVSTIYRSAGFDFETSWFAIFFLLDLKGETTISELASDLSFSQPAVSQIVSTLEKKGLVKVELLESDRRVRFVSLTEEGKILLEKVKPVWQLIKLRMRQLLNEGEKSKHLLEALDELESAFENKGLASAVIENLGLMNLRIVPYTETHEMDKLKELLFEWIKEHGAPSLEFVNNPEHTIKTSNTLVAMKDGNPVAMMLFKKQNQKTTAFLIEKSDRSNNMEDMILDVFFKYLRGSGKIYLCIPCSAGQDLLLRSGFASNGKCSFSEELKPLCLFEGVL